MKRNVEAKKPFYAAYWPQITPFTGFPEKITVSAGMLQEGIARFDIYVGKLMEDLKALGIEDNTLVILMADNGPMIHHGPTGMVETLYRGGKGDFLEGGVRVTAHARWPVGLSKKVRLSVISFTRPTSSPLLPISPVPRSIFRPTGSSMGLTRPHCCWKVIRTAVVTTCSSTPATNSRRP
jgi:hypothetical protein